MKYLGVIPIIVGDRKVITPDEIINGMPIFYWTVKYAKESKKLRSFVVVTNNREIKKMVNSYRIKVLDTLNNTASDFDVLKQVFESLDAENVVLLKPTNPIRYHDIIDECIRVFEEEKADSLVTGFINRKFETFSNKSRGKFENDKCIEIYKTSVMTSNEPIQKNQIKYKVPQEYGLRVETKLDLVAVDAVMRHIGIKL